MFPHAVPCKNDVVEVTTVVRHLELCIVQEVNNGMVRVSHGVNDVFELPMTDLKVVCRPGMRE